MKTYITVIGMISIIVASISINAAGIAFTGPECANQDNVNDMSVTGFTIESKIEIIKRNPNGTYNVDISGGLPRLSTVDSDFCIETKKAFGYKQDKEINEGELTRLPERVVTAKGLAWYDRDILVITVPSIEWTKEPKFNEEFELVTSSTFTTHNTVLILSFLHNENSFFLNQVMRSVGVMNNVGSPRGIYKDVVIPDVGFYNARSFNLIFYKIFK